VKNVRADGHDLSARRNALGELRAARRGCDHHVAFAFTGFEKRPDVSDGIGARLSLRVQIVERDPDG